MQCILLSGRNTSCEVCQLSGQTLTPIRGETPTDFADRVGAWHRDSGHRKRVPYKGQFFTPPSVARYIARCVTTNADPIRILDPGAGVGILGAALVEEICQTRKKVSIHIDAVEIDSAVAELCSRVFSHLKSWTQSREVEFSYNVEQRSFINWAAERLSPSPNGGKPVWDSYDIVVMNAPYFKLRRADDSLKRISKLVGWSANMYTMFLSIAARMLRPNGILASINPRSFTCGKYFESFREDLLHQTNILRIHSFRERRGVFEHDDVFQEIVVLVLQAKGSQKRHEKIAVSTSRNREDLKKSTPCYFAIQDIVASSSDCRIGIPSGSQDLEVIKTVNSWESSFSDLGLDISTGPVVPFRSAARLSHKMDGSCEWFPLIWMNNVFPMKVVWPLKNSKPQYIIRSKKSMKQLVASNRYVVLRRFTAREEERRLVAAVIPKGFRRASRIGLENHLNYIHSNGGSLRVNFADGLAVLLNSDILDRYFRIYNGTTQVNAYDLQLMPLPSRMLVEEIGKEYRREVGRRGVNLQKVDDIVDAVLGLKSHSS